VRGYGFGKRLLECRVFEDGSLFPMRLKRGRGRMFVVTGGNAAGKSLVRRVAGLICRDDKQEFMGLSMEGRSGSSLMNGPVRAMLYGDESYNATGLLSAGLVLSGISTCRSRENRHTIFWDEPDLGLSDEAAAAVGIKLAEFADDLPDKTEAVFVATHSRHLVKQVLPARPHWIHMGEGEHKTLAEWADREVEPADLELLEKEARRRMKAVFALEKRKR